MKNAYEITTFDNDQVTPDWKSTARSGEDVALDHTKLDELLNGLTSSLTSRGAWCTAENGAMPTMSNDWKAFKEGIVRFIFDPRQPDHESKFLVVWWKKGGSTMMIGCAHCMRGYNIDLPEQKAASQKLISNKSKKDWAGFKTIYYMCRDQKATGNERGRGGAQASTEKALTPKAAWTPKHQQQDNKSWHSSTDGHCGGGKIIIMDNPDSLV